MNRFYKREAVKDVLLAGMEDEQFMDAFYQVILCSPGCGDALQNSLSDVLLKMEREAAYVVHNANGITAMVSNRGSTGDDDSVFLRRRKDGPEKEKA